MVVPLGYCCFRVALLLACYVAWGLRCGSLLCCFALLDAVRLLLAELLWFVRCLVG